jgi:hypothetical protein
MILPKVRRRNIKSTLGLARFARDTGFAEPDGSTKLLLQLNVRYS